MSYAISTYTLFSLPAAAAVETLIHKGWKSIEIMGEGEHHGRPLLEMSRKELEKIAKLAKDHGVSLGFHMPIDGCNPSSPDQKTKRIVNKALLAAKVLDVDYVLFHLGNCSFMNEGIKTAAEFFKNLLKELPEPMKLVIENVPFAEGAVGVTMDQLISVIERVNDPRMGIMLDTGHCYMNKGVGFFNECEKAFPYLFGLHINDNHGLQDEHLQIGEGTIPFMPLLYALRGKQLVYVFETNTVQRAQNSKEFVENSWRMNHVKDPIAQRI